MRNLQRKALKSLENNVQINEYIRVLERYFNDWKISTLSAKLSNKLVKRRVFMQLKMNQDRGMRKNMLNVMAMTADNCYERCLKAKVFEEWKSIHRIDGKYMKLIEFRKKK